MTANLHDALYESVRGAGHIEDLLVIAKLADNRLGLDEGDDGPLRVFIPDLHLLPPGHVGDGRGRWNYKTNGLAHFADLLAAVQRVRAAAGADRVEVIVLGDLIDLWRLGRKDNDPAEVVSAHRDVFAGLESLDAYRIYGNHDIELSLRDPYDTIWNRQIYLPVGAEHPRCLALHGDVFDWLERALSIDVKAFFLNVFGRGVDGGEADLTHMTALARMREAAERGNKLLDPNDWATMQESAATRPTKGMGEFNARGRGGGSPRRAHKFLARAHHHARWAAEQNGLRHALRSMVIGHTHQVGIGVVDEGGEFFALFDCGAWIGDARLRIEGEPKIKRIPSAQFGAQFGNDFRIYQVVGKERTGLELTDDD